MRLTLSGTREPLDESSYCEARSDQTSGKIILKFKCSFRKAAPNLYHLSSILRRTRSLPESAMGVPAGSSNRRLSSGFTKGPTGRSVRLWFIRLGPAACQRVAGGLLRVRCGRRRAAAFVVVLSHEWLFQEARWDVRFVQKVNQTLSESVKRSRWRLERQAGRQQAGSRPAADRRGGRKTLYWRHESAGGLATTAC